MGIHENNLDRKCYERGTGFLAHLPCPLCTRMCRPIQVLRQLTHFHEDWFEGSAVVLHPYAMF